jgi:hypothetical protein
MPRAKYYESNNIIMHTAMVNILIAPLKDFLKLVFPFTNCVVPSAFVVCPEKYLKRCMINDV